MASISFGIPTNLTITGNLTVSTLASGRVPFASTGGLLVDDADFTFATDTLTATKGTFGSITHIANAIAAANSVTSVAGQNLVLAVGTGGTALTLTNSTLVATFAGQIAAASASAHTLGPVTFTNGVVTALTSAAAPTATALTLTGGDSGASISLGALSGGNATITLTPQGTGDVAIAGTGSQLTIAGTTAATSTTTGSLINAGGFGNAGAAYIGGILDVAGQTISLRHASNPSLGLYEGATATASVSSFGGDLYIAIDQNTSNSIIFRRNSGTEMVRFAGSTGNVTLASTTASISSTTGSFINAGGFGNAGAIFGGSNLSLTAATSTITLGSTNTGSIAVDANGALTVTPKSGQVTTVASNLTVSGTGHSSFAGPINVAGMIATITASRTMIDYASDVVRIAGFGPNASTKPTFQIYLATGDNSSSISALTLGATGDLLVAGTGPHTFGTTNTVSFAAGAITATAVGAHTFGTTNTVVMTAGVVTANGVGAHVFGTTNTVTLQAGVLTTTAGIVAGTTLAVNSTTEATALGTAAATLLGGLSVAKTGIIGLGLGLGVTSTATAAGTTTLAAGSRVIQVFTGTTTQTCQLPAANLMGANVSVVFVIKNRSTGIVTVQRAGSDTIDGSTSVTLNTNDSITLASDGSALWVVV